MQPAHLLRSKTGRPSRNRTCDLPCIRRMHRLPCSRSVEPRARIELASSLQERRIAGNACGAKNLEPAERIERPSVAYHATALPLSYTGWSRRADSNRHLSFTRAPFFPLNYFDLLNEDLERVTGLEPVSGPWRGPILAARRYPLGASGENRTLLASLEIWNSTNKSRSLELQRLTFICQRTHFDGSTWTVRSLQP